MDLKKSLKEQIKKAKETFAINDDVSAFLHMTSDNIVSNKSDRDQKNESIRTLFKEGFEINDPSGTKKIGSKVIQQVLWRVMSKVKFLDAGINATGADENTERIVTEGVMTIADRGGLATCFRDKAGVFMNAFLFGDGLLLMGKGENDENPISFQVLRNEDVYADNFCYGVRGVRPANRICVIRQYDKQEAYEIWPELEENGIFGRIPGTFQSTDRQEDRENDQILEVAYGFDRTKQKYIIFAGAQAHELDRFEGDEYPFIKNKKPYIPVFQFICQPAIDSFWNHGIGEMVYDLAVITRKLLNMEVTHIEENVLPFTLINAPQSKVDELMEKMAMAQKARKMGMKPVVAMEFDPNGGQQSVAAQSLVTQNLINEWQIIWDRLYRELSRLGINLDDIERGSGITRGQVIAEEQASNAFVLQMMEYNASETKELIECVIDAITEFVSEKNKTPINLLTRINLPDGSTTRLSTEPTFGMLSKELKDWNWFVTADSRTGAIPSDLTKMIYEERALQMTPPGTPEFKELYRRINMRRGVDMQLVSNQLGQAPQGTPQPVPAATQRVLPEEVGNTLQPV